MMVTKQNDAKPPWLLLVYSLPRKGASLRVTVWRKLQRHGALPLGNSGYFLPNTEENRERFEWLATAVRTEGGEASVLEVQAIDNCSFEQMKQQSRDGTLTHDAAFQKIDEHRNKMQLADDRDDRLS